MKDIVEDNNGNTWLCTDGGLDVLPLTKINAILVCGQEHDDSSVINKEPLNTFLITDTSVWCAEWGGSICEHQIQSGKNHWYSTGPQDGYNYILISSMWVVNYGSEPFPVCITSILLAEELQKSGFLLMEFLQLIPFR